MRIVIAEDSVLLRDGIARLLADSGHEVVAMVGDGDGLVDAIVRLRPDVSVVDVRMPPTFRDEGVKAAIEARKQVRGAPVLILSQYVERTYATELLADKLGGIGYLLKDRVTDVDEFVTALERVAGGGTALDPEVVSQLFARMGGKGIAGLSPRERDVLGLIAEGASNAAIAERLCLASGSVEKYITSIFLKLDLPPSDDSNRRVLAVIQYLQD